MTSPRELLPEAPLRPHNFPSESFISTNYHSLTADYPTQETFLSSLPSSHFNDHLRSSATFSAQSPSSPNHIPSLAKITPQPLSFLSLSDSYPLLPPSPSSSWPSPRISHPFPRQNLPLVTLIFSGAGIFPYSSSTILSPPQEFPSSHLCLAENFPYIPASGQNFALSTFVLSLLLYYHIRRRCLSATFHRIRPFHRLDLPKTNYQPSSRRPRLSIITLPPAPPSPPPEALAPLPIFGPATRDKKLGQ